MKKKRYVVWYADEPDAYVGYHRGYVLFMKGGFPSAYTEEQLDELGLSHVFNSDKYVVKEVYPDKDHYRNVEIVL